MKVGKLQASVEEKDRFIKELLAKLELLAKNKGANNADLAQILGEYKLSDIINSDDKNENSPNHKENEKDQGYIFVKPPKEEYTNPFEILKKIKLQFRCLPTNFTLDQKNLTLRMYDSMNDTLQGKPKPLYFKKYKDKSGSTMFERRNKTTNKSTDIYKFKVNLTHRKNFSEHVSKKYLSRNILNTTALDSGECKFYLQHLICYMNL